MNELDVLSVIFTTTTTTTMVGIIYLLIIGITVIFAPFMLLCMGIFTVATILGD